MTPFTSVGILVTPCAIPGWRKARTCRGRVRAWWDGLSRESAYESCPEYIHSDGNKMTLHREDGLLARLLPSWAVDLVGGISDDGIAIRMHPRLRSDVGGVLRWEANGVLGHGPPFSQPLIGLCWKLRPLIGLDDSGNVFRRHLLGLGQVTKDHAEQIRLEITRLRWHEHLPQCQTWRGVGQPKTLICRAGLRESQGTCRLGARTAGTHMT